MPDIKFCGLTREADAVEAARLGARYAGFVLTGSPRRVSVAAVTVLRDALRGMPIRTVAVFGNEPEDEILAAAERSGVDVVQLHGAASASLPARLRASLGVEVWRVVRVMPRMTTHESRPGSPGPEPVDEADPARLAGVDGVLLDTFSAGALGGTGTPFDWGEAVDVSRRVRRGRRLIVAGGLRPGNVAEAIGHLAPDVVDVSSGVEASPGVKDHALMAAFVAAVQSTHATARP